MLTLRTTWAAPGNRTSLLAPSLLSTCNIVREPAARRVMGSALRLVPCRQFGRDHTRYQVQLDAAPIVEAAGCQPAPGSRAGCNRPGAATGNPAPPSRPERCGAATGGVALA